MTNEVDNLMGFNPNDLSVFAETEKVDRDVNLYKTNPNKFATSEDGHYRSKVRILYNPFNPKDSIINQCLYVLKDTSGMFFVKSKLGDGDRECPIFKAWKKLWYVGDEAKEFARNKFERTESQWVLVQIIEDVNRPELVGQFKAMKLPKCVYESMIAKINPPADAKKQSIPLMDYLIGRCLDIDVTPGPDDPKAPERKNREISYSLCSFDDDIQPIIKTDGTPFFTDEEIELIETYSNARVAVFKAKEKDKAAKQAEFEKLKEQVKPLYLKALDYMKVNVVDIRKECGYTEWTPDVEERVEKWCAIVTQMKDPTVMIVNESGSAEVAPTEQPETQIPMGDADGLPF